MDNRLENLSLELEKIPAGEVNGVLSQLVARHWQKSPWSNTAPQIIDTAKADVGVGLAMYYVQTGSRRPAEDAQVILAKVAGRDKYQIFGGFMNLTANGDASLTDAAARETGSEELVDQHGHPLIPFTILATRLGGKAPLDLKKIEVRGQPRLVTSFDYRVDELEYSRISEFEKMLRVNPAIGQGMLKATKGEIDGIGIFPLTQMLVRPEMLNHIDQASLFQKLYAKLSP